MPEAARSAPPPAADRPARLAVAGEFVAHRDHRFSATWRDDVPSAIVVALVALPLCLGIALASGAPLFSGIVAGVVGGIVVGVLSGSQLMVTGPAAGLTAIVLTSIARLGSFEAFLAAVVVAGVMQVALGVVRAGIIGYYFPSSVIKGMLAAIGLILILKQLPHALGYDTSYEGDQSFAESDNENTFTAIGAALGRTRPGAIVVSVAALAALMAWNRPALKRIKLLPGPLVAVLIGVGLNALFAAAAPSLVIAPEHLVALPVLRSAAELVRQLAAPDWSALARPELYVTAVTIAVVASLETLLSLEATDKMDPYKREAPPNRELIAQGVGNTLSGLVGGLPLTGVIVRSSANIDAGAKTRWSAVLHGFLLAIAVMTIPGVLNRIPLAALAAILIYTGYKLAHPKLFVAAWKVGREHFASFVVTIVAILLTDLLVGIAIGLAVAFIFILLDQLRAPALADVTPPGGVLRRYVLGDQVSFLSKASVATTLEAIPDGARVEIDGRATRRIDHDVRELLTDFRATARLRGIDYRLVGVDPVATAPSHKH